MHRIPPPRHPGLLYTHGGAAPGSAVLDFSVNLNPLGPPASALEAIREHLPDIGRYPPRRSHALANRLAEGHGLIGTQVLIGNGASEWIDAIARVHRARRIAIVEPTYTEYHASCVRACGPRRIAVEHWLPDDGDFAPVPAPLHPETRLVWLGHPNNPTGRLWPRDALLRWIEATPGTLFAIDESFLSFRSDEAERSLIPELRSARTASGPHNLIVLRSLTKVYALAGLRLGYMVVPLNAGGMYDAYQPPWSVNALAQVAGLAAANDRDYLERTRAWFATEQPAFGAALRGVSPDLEVIPSDANFFLLRLRGVHTAGELTRRLLQRGIAIRDASNFVGLDDRYVRVAVRSAAENRRLLDELRLALSEGPP